MSGGSGCIGGLSNLYPELFSAWVRLSCQGYEGSRKIQKEVNILCDLYDVGKPFIPIMKKAMMLRGIEMQDYCTNPFLRQMTLKPKKL